MTTSTTKDVWEKAQKYESEWWRTPGLGAANSYHEELKQHKYAEKMGIVIDEWSRIDLRGKGVLDVGGGPASMLLKAYNSGKRKVIDPLDMPDWAVTRYKYEGIELQKIPAEDMDESGWDETWIYNVLQHVQDPMKVLEKVKKAGRILRIFEFLERPANEGHPHVLTSDMLNAALGKVGTIARLADPVVGTVYFGAFDFSQPTIELHMVNTGTTFPYAYYLAVMSVLKTQKAAKINLWIVKEPVGKYYDTIKGKVVLRRIEEEVPEFPALQDKKPGFKEAHLVDYYRWRILHDNGGVFIDLDSLSLSDYCGFIEEKLSSEKEFLASLAVSERIPKPYHNSLFAGKKDSELVKEMLDECVKRLNDGTDFKWGNSGPDVLNDLCAANQHKVAEAEYGLLGGCLELYQLFKADGKLPDNIRFIHLWANSINGFWNGITEDYIENSDHLYARLVRGLLDEKERNPFNVHKVQPLNDFINARGKHYRPIFKYLEVNRHKNIMEIGTYTGENAVQMIRACKSDVHYYGFDLFEEITQDKITTELSHPATPSMAGVKEYIESCISAKAKVTLFGGDTNVTLKSVIKDLPSMDMIYIDGGHSVKTVGNDWKYASRLMKDNTVVFFDDYFTDMPFIGCKTLVDGIDKMKYEVEVLPDHDDYPKPYGHLRSQLAAVQLKTEKVKKLVSDKPVLHVLGLAHTKTNKEYVACAYTQKVLKMCKMMKALGYTVYHYGAEGSEVDCTEHVQVVSDAIQLQTYGGYDWKKEMFRHDPKDLAYTTFNQNAIKAINERKGPKDLLLISMGNYQKPIFDQVGLMGVEMGIGYTGVFTDKRIFESYAWMHYIYGMMYPNSGGCDGCNYDAVIPNYYDPDDFEFCEKKEDYYLYMGRFIGRKGAHIAAQCCERIGARLIMAGQGTEETVRACGIDPKSVEFVGYADVKMRSNLMSKAKAIFVPTLYLEPFGGVNVEAMFCGTPAITTDWGGFTETVQHGKTGYRCRTMDDFVWAAKNVDKLDPKYIRDYAMNNYSMDRVSLMYSEYFMKLMDLWRGGWYEPHPERTQLDWLSRWY